MTYSDETTVTNIVKGIDQTIKDDNMDVAIDFADTRINSQLLDADVPIPTDFTPTGDDDPINLLVKAGNLYTAAFLNDVNFVSPDARRPTAAAFEKQADDLVNRYIKIYESENDTTVIGVVGTYVYDKDYQ